MQVLEKPAVIWEAFSYTFSEYIIVCHKIEIRVLNLGWGFPEASLFFHVNIKIKFPLWVKRKIFKSENVKYVSNSKWTSSLGIPFVAFSINKN